MLAFGAQYKYVLFFLKKKKLKLSRCKYWIIINILAQGT